MSLNELLAKARQSATGRAARPTAGADLGGAGPNGHACVVPGHGHSGDLAGRWSPGQARGEQPTCAQSRSPWTRRRSVV